MDIDLIAMTVYGMISWTIALVITYKLDHVHHWMFGVGITIIIIPVMIMDSIIRRTYYDNVIIVGLILGLFSFIIDFHDFKSWIRKKLKKKKH